MLCSASTNQQLLELYRRVIDATIDSCKQTQNPAVLRELHQRWTREVVSRVRASQHNVPVTSSESITPLLINDKLKDGKQENISVSSTTEVPPKNEESEKEQVAETDDEFGDAEIHMATFSPQVGDKIEYDARIEQAGSVEQIMEQEESAPEFGGVAKYQKPEEGSDLDDDLSDLDDLEPDTKNDIIVAQFFKVGRSDSKRRVMDEGFSNARRPTWKASFKNGIIRIGDHELVFHRCEGDFLFE